MNTFPAPQELDAQSKILIKRWIEVGSQEWRELDNTPGFTKMIIRELTKEPAYLFADTLGRLWGKGEDGRYYPFHFTSFGENIGYRVSARAAN